MGLVIGFLEQARLIIFLMGTTNRDRVTVLSKNGAIAYKNLPKNMKLKIWGLKIWGRFIPGFQNLRPCETWLPELLSKFSNPFHPGTQD